MPARDDSRVGCHQRQDRDPGCFRGCDQPTREPKARTSNSVSRAGPGCLANNTRPVPRLVFGRDINRLHEIRLASSFRRSRMADPSGIRPSNSDESHSARYWCVVCVRRSVPHLPITYVRRRVANDVRRRQHPAWRQVGEVNPEPRNLISLAYWRRSGPAVSLIILDALPTRS